MITPSPTSKIDPALARGVLESIAPETAARPGYIVLAIPNTSYQLHLRPTADVSARLGKRLIGTIRVQARRIDVVGTGGEYMEPVMGRPRRVQGTVVGLTASHLIVDAGTKIHLQPLDPRQSPSSFQVGQLVSCDVLDGATFTPQA